MFRYALNKSDISIWVIIGATPIIAISLLAIYVAGGATGSMIIDWIAETSDREEIKRTILNIVKVILYLSIPFIILYLIGG